MTYKEALSFEHFTYPMPYDVGELGGYIYRASDELKEIVEKIYTHPHFKHTNLFLDISQDGSKALVNDMAIRALAMTDYYLKNPQQFGHNMDNIHLQILVRMWKHLFKHARYQNKYNFTQYHSMTLKMVSKELGLLECLVDSIRNEKFIKSGDDLVKKRKGKGLREGRVSLAKEGKGLGYSDDTLDALCNLAENEIVGNGVATFGYDDTERW